MDMTQYLDLFLEESLENVQKLNQNLLEIEKNPGNMDSIDEVFRAAHTLKGMSATMGFESIAQLTHKMENLLDKLRERQIIVNTEIINILFKAVDALETMLDSIRKDMEPNLDIEDLSRELIRLESGKSENNTKNPENTEQTLVEPVTDKEPDLLELNEYEKNIINNGSEKGFHGWQVKINVDPGCLMKGVRAFMVIKNLENLGEIIKSQPHVQDLEDEKFENDFIVIIVSGHTENEILSNLNSIAEVNIEYILEIKNIQSPEEDVYKDEVKDLGSQTLIQDEKHKKQNTADKTKRSHQTVRVDIGRLDNLMSLVGELVINKTRLEQIYASKNLVELNEAIEQINRITTDLQSVVQNVRMVAIDQVFNRFPRMVRDLSQELNKSVNLILEGKETELDRTVIDEIGDPLVHLIRNAIDHGLESAEERIALGKPETGTLIMSAKHEGNTVIICVEDDGRGIDVQKIKSKAIQNGLLNAAQAEGMEESTILSYIFEPGFSTANAVTDISGRGVGLDVVKSKIQSLSGKVSLENKVGQGSKFVIKLPLTLAIIQALLVKVQKEVFAIPLGNINETTSLEIQDIKNIQGQQVMVLRGKVLPLVFLKELLEIPGERTGNEMYVVVVQKGEQQIGLVAEELVGQQEIVINSIGKILSGIRGIAGASILGDGRISLILDIGTLF